MTVQHDWYIVIHHTNSKIRYSPDSCPDKPVQCATMCYIWDYLGGRILADPNKKKNITGAALGLVSLTQETLLLFR